MSWFLLYAASAQIKPRERFWCACVKVMSAFDAVDGSSTRHMSATDVGAVKAPTIRRSQSCKRLPQ